MSSEGQPAAEEPHGSLWLQLRRQWGGGREAPGEVLGPQRRWVVVRVLSRGGGGS